MIIQRSLKSWDYFEFFNYLKLKHSVIEEIMITTILLFNYLKIWLRFSLDS